MNNTEVVSQVAKDKNGFGICLYDGKTDLGGVKVLGVTEKVGGVPVLPDIGPVIQKDYPLAEDLSIFLPQDASSTTRDFCTSCQTEVVAEFALKCGLITPFHQWKAAGDRRRMEMKTGKGPRVSAVGGGVSKRAMQDVGVEYVTAKAVVQLAYSPIGSDVSAVGEFMATVPVVVPATQPASGPVVTPFVAGGGTELLLLSDRPSEAAMKIHGDKWNALQPAEFMLAGRAAAVIVNSSNKLDSLTLEQVRAIFSCDVDDWATIGGTDLKAAAGAKGAIPVNRFGPLPSDAAAGVFFKECLPQEKVKRVTFKGDAAATISAVSMDPQAIAFVDLSAIPTTGQTVKVLGIRLKTSIGGKDGERVETSYLPTAENIKNAMYPFSQRLYLYVHPKASDTAKDFAKFIATCGGSEATPYADTVKAMMDTYQKNGLIPLADTAIDRAAKDAEAAAAAAKAKEEAAKQPKPKGK
jgi:ABC-type phosphate transport system substrate-binding protein